MKKGWKIFTLLCLGASLYSSYSFAVVDLSHTPDQSMIIDEALEPYGLLPDLGIGELLYGDVPKMIKESFVEWYDKKKKAGLGDFTPENFFKIVETDIAGGDGILTKRDLKLFLSSTINIYEHGVARSLEDRIIAKIFEDAGARPDQESIDLSTINRKKLQVAFTEKN